MTTTYCSHCGAANPATDDGYTLCCNEPVSFSPPEPAEMLDWDWDDPFAPKAGA